MADRLGTALMTLLKDPTEENCDAVCDLIIVRSPLTDRETELTMLLAHRIDPSESNHAAHIRDIIREN